MKVDFQIIGITEHKIKEVTPISNIKLAGYHEFIYTPMQTSHGGSGFCIQDSLAFKKRNDLLLITVSSPPPPFFKGGGGWTPPKIGKKGGGG